MPKKFRQLLYYNLKTLLKFECIYKLLSTIVFVPLFLSIFSWITKWSGYSYLTFENCFSFLMHPLTLLFLLLFFIVLTFYTLLDISTVILILECSKEKKTISVKDAFFLALNKSFQIFHRKNFFLPFLVLFLIPFLNIGISQGIISTISIPEFIIDYIYKNKILLFLYILLFVSLLFLFFRWLYVLHYFVLEDCNFKEARKKSAHLSKQKRFKDALFLCLMQIFIAIFYMLFVVVGILCILFFYHFLEKIQILGNLSITIIWMLIAFSMIVMLLLSTPISYAMISVLYYQHKEEKKEEQIVLKLPKKEGEKEKKKSRILKYIILLLLLTSGTLFTTSVLNGTYDFNIEYIRTMEVTAHRGASVLYPENTMPAFLGAKQLGADWIELDVQQTKDRKLIILHDTNLKRTTGVDKNTWEITYPEVEKLDAGSFFDEKFKNTKIPLLEEVILFAKENNIKLNIELKPTGKEKNFEKEVVQLLQKYNFTKNCVITSQTYDVLKKVKDYDASIETVYVMSLAYGNITQLSKADHFSIEASSVTKTMVNQVHNAGKELYVWTVNTKESIEKMVEFNVDNIITDNIVLAKDTIYQSKTSNLIQEYMKFINQLFK